MTIEEVIRILDNETSRDTLWKYDGEENRKAACFEACQLAADELRKHQWISVKDRLPENSQEKVLIVTEIGVLYGFYAYQCWYAFSAATRKIELLKLPVTHWQPLPELPKEREENA